MSNKEDIRVLVVGDTSVSKTEVRKHLEACVVIEQPYKFEVLMENPVSPEPAMVICAEPQGGISLIDVAQTLRMQYQNCGIFYVSVARMGFNRKELLKNGFTDAFLLPGDAPVLAEMLKRELAKASNGKLKHYRTVKFVDIQPGTVLDFDVHLHLPHNKKYLRYSAAGQPLDEVRAERLASHKVNSVYVASEQMPVFYKYMAEQLRKIGSSDLSETERQEKRENAVRELLSGMFSDSGASGEDSLTRGRQIVGDCQEIIKAYVIDSSEGKNNWYKSILMTSGARSNAYSQAVNVSTFAALFSIGLGVGNPEELALAGLLYDIGLTDIPLEIQTKDESLRTPEEVELYKTHPQKSIDIIKSRKMIVSELVHKIILQHHERYDGTGYPIGLSGARVCQEAQILGLAELFNQLTAFNEEKPRYTPEEAVLEIEKGSSMGNISKARFNPHLVSKLISLFPKSETPEKKKA